jgi:hypothetical protein
MNGSVEGAPEARSNQPRSRNVSKVLTQDGNKNIMLLIYKDKV